MSKFIGDFVREIDNKKTSFQQLFGLDDKTNMIESILKEELNKHWHNLPVSVNFFKNEFFIIVINIIKSHIVIPLIA